MKTLIQNGHVLDPDTGKNGIYDVLISDGKIEKVQEKIDVSSAEQVISAEGKYVMPGLIDLHVHFRDPGFEY